MLVAKFAGKKKQKVSSDILQQEMDHPDDRKFVTGHSHVVVGPVPSQL